MKVLVIGGGISGLATAFRIRERFQARGVPLDMRVLEAADRAGGKIQTEIRDGFLLEWGPNGFLDNRPDTLTLCRDLGLEQDLLKSNEEARKRYVFSQGKLHLVPDSPFSFFSSPLLSLGGRLRILKEIWAPTTPPGVDTSIAEFGRRRLGREAVEKLLDPMVAGIFAGDPAIQSLESCFPRIAELEQEYGGLVRAMYSLMRERRCEEKARTRGGLPDKNGEGRAGGGPAGPGGVLMSFKNGMGQLVEVLEEQLGDMLQTRCTVKAILPEPGPQGASGYRVSYRDQGVEREEHADAVVMAVPAYEATKALKGTDADLSRLLSIIPYAPMVVLGLGFSMDESPGPMDGFGFLVPYVENTPVLGTLWASSIFHGRAPSGHVLTRNMVGGWRNPWALTCESQELEGLVGKVHEKAMGSSGKIHFRKVIRHPQAIPLYILGHGERLREIERRLKPYSGLYLTGNAFRGVALNDCSREAVRVARQVEEDLIDTTMKG